jgi:hypothetical protein
LRQFKQGVTTRFHNGNGISTTDCREILQKLVEAATIRQVIEYGPNRNASAGKDRRAPKNIGITLNWQGLKLRGAHSRKLIALYLWVKIQAKLTSPQ